MKYLKGALALVIGFLVGALIATAVNILASGPSAVDQACWAKCRSQGISEELCRRWCTNGQRDRESKRRGGRLPENNRQIDKD